MLLILTSDKDLTADFLIVKLIEKDLSYFRLNVEELAGAAYEFATQGARIVTTAAGRMLNLDLVKTVWYRRALYPVVSSDFSPPERYFLSGELRHLVFGMAWNPAIRWVNPIDKVFVAEHKLYQLRLAQQLGMLVPKSLAISSLKDAAYFVQQIHKGPSASRSFMDFITTGRTASRSISVMFR